MRQFFRQMIGMILACALLGALALVLYVASSYVDSIVSSKGASVNTEQVKKSVTVVLDPGHGGMDGGAVGISGTPEKELNLLIAVKIRSILESNGFSVVMTRDNDTMLTHSSGGTRKQQDLRARVETVSSIDNPVLVSIHMNRFPDSSVKGMTFYYSPNHPDSYRLAELFHVRLLETLQPSNRRPIKESDDTIYLLYHTSCPAVLVECGFLSNPLEEAMLSEEDYQNAVAAMLADAIMSFVREKESP